MEKLSKSKKLNVRISSIQLSSKTMDYIVLDENICDKLNIHKSSGFWISKNFVEEKEKKKMWNLLVTIYCDDEIKLHYLGSLQKIISGMDLIKAWES
jgi:hypothetical protein